MRMTYDPEADALMLRLSEVPVEESAEVAPNVVLDFDGEGRVVGIEVLFVSDLSRRQSDGAGVSNFARGRREGGIAPVGLAIVVTGRGVAHSPRRQPDVVIEPR